MRHASSGLGLADNLLLIVDCACCAAQTTECAEVGRNTIGPEVGMMDTEGPTNLPNNLALVVDSERVRFRKCLWHYVGCCRNGRELRCHCRYRCHRDER